MKAPEESPETEVACRSMRSPAALSAEGALASPGIPPSSTGMLPSREASGSSEGGEPASCPGWAEEGGPGDGRGELDPEHPAKAASKRGSALLERGAAMGTPLRSTRLEGRSGRTAQLGWGD